MEQFANNGSSMIALLTLLANRMVVQQHGTLAVISSVAGDRGRPSNYLYGAAKAAVSTFCEGLRVRLFKAGVHVITIKPGLVDTPMTRGLALPSVLVAQPDMVARRIVRGINRQVAVLYVPGFWAVIMWLIRVMPQPLFKRLNL
jgi:short-subunit dehydrogenase